MTFNVSVSKITSKIGSGIQSLFFTYVFFGLVLVLLVLLFTVVFDLSCENILLDSKKHVIAGCLLMILTKNYSVFFLYVQKQNKRRKK